MTTEGAYDTFIEVCRERKTSRAFDSAAPIPREHYDLILEAARHGPSGANAQPWHYIVVTSPEKKQALADYFVAEATARAKRKMKFPTPNYRGLATAPGLIVVVADFRYIDAFPVLNDGSELDKMYKENEANAKEELKQLREKVKRLEGSDDKYCPMCGKLKESKG